jgi:hypothetical protein
MFAPATEPGNDELVHYSKPAIRRWKNEFK